MKEGKSLSNLPQQNKGVSLASSAAAGIPQTIVVGAVIDIVKESIVCFTDYMKFKQQETTERQRIRDMLKAITLQIEANKEVTIKALDDQHEKFKMVMDHANQALEMAKEERDTEMVKSTFEFIIQMSKIIGSQSDSAVDIFLNNGARLHLNR
jgi:imidazoleglycerol phosphate dehydratase HisB